MKIQIINGPNLNLLGVREPGIYGSNSFESYLPKLKAKFPDIEIEYFQSNIEGELINKLQEVGFSHDGVVLNAGAYTHTSIALQDCIRSLKCPCVEVHISNVHKREEFRHHSYISCACLGVICGFGLASYELAISGILAQKETEGRTPESCTSCAAQYCSSSSCFSQSGARLLRWQPSPSPWYPPPWSSYRWRTVRGQRDARSCRRESTPADGRVHPSAPVSYTHLVDGFDEITHALAPVGYALGYEEARLRAGLPADKHIILFVSQRVTCLLYTSISIWVKCLPAKRVPRVARV